MKAATLKLVIAWMAVILPLGWGVYKSAIKSKPLFFPTPAATGSRTESGTEPCPVNEDRMSGREPSLAIAIVVRQGQMRS